MKELPRYTREPKASWDSEGPSLAGNNHSRWRTRGREDNSPPRTRGCGQGKEGSAQDRQFWKRHERTIQKTRSRDSPGPYAQGRHHPPSRDTGASGANDFKDSRKLHARRRHSHVRPDQRRHMARDPAKGSRSIGPQHDRPHRGRSRRHRSKKSRRHYALPRQSELGRRQSRPSMVKEHSKCNSGSGRSPNSVTTESDWSATTISRGTPENYREA